MKTKNCSTCHDEKSIDDFYAANDHSYGKMSICKQCFNNYCVKRWISRKIRAIHYKGSKCVDCQLSYPETHYAVFEFHHLEPLQKEFSWTKLRLYGWSRIESELNKCVLLCANCHRIRHTLD